MQTAEQEYVAEFSRTYDEVIAAHRQGYHKPYSNEHSDEALWSGYHEGFRAALYDLRVKAA